MDLIASGAQRTMSSRELATISNKRHDNVMRICRDLRGTGVCPQIKETPYVEPSNGQTYTECLLNQRDSYVAMARLSPEFTAALVDRWQELEAVTKKPAELSRMDILRLAMEAEEGRLRAEAALALAAPKVEMVDRYMDATGTQTFRQVAKLLGAKEPAFRAFLAARRILYQIGGTWTPYAEHLDAGRFVVKTGSANNGHAFSAAQFTPKGVAWVSALWLDAVGAKG